MIRITASLAALLASLMVATVSAQEQPPAASVLPWLKLEDLTATRERPLFAEDRRPLRIVPPPANPAPVVEARPEPEDPKPIPSLKGIIVEGSSTLIVLEDQSTSESVVIRSGDSFGPWQVVAESDRRVRLGDGSEEVVLNLFEPEKNGHDLH